MSEERNAIYDQDLASARTYDLTVQADDLSGDTTPDLTQQASVVRAVTQPASRVRVANVLADASARRSALRLALTMVMGRDGGFLARRR